MLDILYFEPKLKKGRIRKASLKDLPKLKNKKLWIDLTNCTKEEVQALQKTFEIHPLTVEDLFARNARTKVEEFSNYIFCIFYGVRIIRTKVKSIEIDYLIGKNFIITNHEKEFDKITDLKKNKEKLKELFQKGIDFIFHKVLDDQTDNYFPVLEFIDGALDYVEDKVIIKPDDKLLSEIITLKRQIIHIKKHVVSQKEKVAFLAKNDYRFISKKSKPYFRDIYDNTIRIYDSVGDFREVIGGIFDAYVSSLSKDMSEVMKVLSIIATIVLPLTVISGIYGTNFTNLPGATQYNGFWIMIFFMILLVGLMLFYFKKRRWI